MQKMLNGIGTELTASGARENDLGAFHAWFIEPSLEYCCDRFANRNRALFAPLPDDLQIRSFPERQILPSKTGDLSEAQSGLNGQQHQSMVAPARPRLFVGRTEKRLNLWAREISDQSSSVAFTRCRKYPLNLRATAGQFVRGEPKKRTDGSESQVARPSAHSSTALQIVQERGYQGRVDLLEGQPFRRRMQLLRRKT